MFDTETPAQPDTARALLDAVRADRAAADAAEARLLRHALTWADLHPAESIDDAAVLGLSPWDDPLLGRERALPVAGPGAPLVAEFCVAELAAALGLRTEQGRDLVGEVIELAHRLPRIWHSVQNGTLQAWRARRIARATMTLSREAAAHVDRHLFRCAHKVGLPTVDRLVAEAVALFMPALAEQQRRAAAERRCVDIDTRTVSFDGTCRISGELDLADALDLDEALDAGADQLAAAGHDQTKQVLRSLALGDLARGERPLPLGHDTDAPAGSGSGAQPPTVVRRQVVLHVHLSDAVLTGTSATCRVEGTAGQGGRHLTTTEQVRDWCATAGSVRVVPVVDTTAHLSVEAYEVPDRLNDQIAERDVECRFPWCSRPASACDSDHVVEYTAGGPTASDNLAPLCRHHHRLKTHGRWRYTMIEPGTCLWRSPHGVVRRRPHGRATGLRYIPDARDRDTHDPTRTAYRSRPSRPLSRPGRRDGA